MRIVGRILLVLAVVMALGGLYREDVGGYAARWLRQLAGEVGGEAAADMAAKWFGLGGPATGSRAQDERLARSRVSLAYRLGEDAWLDFPLPSATDAVKVVTNVILPRGVEPDTERVHYVLDYQVLDQEGRLLSNGQYHHLTKHSLFRDPSGELTPARYFFDDESIPADGRVMLVNLENIPPGSLPSLARVRLRRLARPGQGALCRVYARETLDREQAPVMWNRLKKRVKERLARGNVYPPQYLTDGEKANLLTFNWRPLGPLGVEGEDYDLVRVYVYNDVEPREHEDLEMDRGMVVGPHLRATLAVPEEGGDYVFGFGPVDNATGMAEIVWYGKRPGEVRALGVRIKGEPLEYEASFEGGLVEVVSMVDSTLEVDAIVNATVSEPVDQTMRVTAYQTESLRPLTYPVSHVRGRSTPFRVSVRAPMFPGQMPPRGLHYTLKGENGTVLLTGAFQLERFEPSLYDLPPAWAVNAALSDPQRVYMDMPPEARSVDFFSSTPLFVDCANRPPGMAKITVVPEDYFRQRSTEDRLPTWYPVLPENRDELAAQRRVAGLKVQYRPPDPDPDLALGNFEWTSFRPEGRWAGRYLLLEADKGREVRDAAVGVRFTRFVPGRKYGVDVDPGGRLNSAELRLVYVRGKSKPARLRVVMDGRTLVSRTVRGTRGEVRLPAVARGRHSLSIDLEPSARVYVNHMRSPAPGHLLRFANRFDFKGLHFGYRKTTRGEETLSFVYYAPEGRPGRCLVEVRLAPVPERGFGPFKDWTVPNRMFDLRPGSGAAVPVLGSRSQWMDQGRPFFFPLGQDLPEGYYDLSVRLLSGEPGYVLMYQVAPGRRESRSVTRTIHEQEN